MLITDAILATVVGRMNIIPYDARGLLNICAAQKQFTLTNRIIMYYKYDSYPVDCVKTFISPERNIVFRFLLVSFFYYFLAFFILSMFGIREHVH